MLITKQELNSVFSNDSGLRRGQKMKGTAPFSWMSLLTNLDSYFAVSTLV
jgi:hypothetical protein